MPELRPEFMPWRTGGSVGRTVYACPPGSSHRNGEILIGMMDSPRLATEAVDAHNMVLKSREQLPKRVPADALIPDPETKPLLKPTEVAKMLSWSKSTVYELIAADQIPALKVGARIWVPTKALREFLHLDAQEVAPSPDLETEP